jgi:hypothetical protein
MVTAAAPLFDGSAMLMAVTTIFGGAVRICGAVYVPAGSTAPHAGPAQPFPETIHVIVRSGFPEEFTVAVNSRAAPSSTGEVCGETDTDMSLMIVISAVAVFELSAALVACKVTELGTGRSRGEV